MKLFTLAHANNPALFFVGTGWNHDQTPFLPLFQTQDDAMAFASKYHLRGVELRIVDIPSFRLKENSHA